MNDLEHYAWKIRQRFGKWNDDDLPVVHCIDRLVEAADLAAEEKRELVEALEFAERRSRQPGEGHTEYFERLADEFYRRHGYLAPGKDDPMGAHISADERRAAWDAFLFEPIEVRRKALAKHAPGQEESNG